MDPKTFGARLQWARIGNGHTKKQAAQAIGVVDETIATWEAGHTWPGDPKFKAVADYLRMDLEELWTLIQKEKTNAA